MTSADRMKLAHGATYDSVIRNQQNSIYDGSIDLGFFESHIVN